MTKMTSKKYSPEVRERAVRMVREHRTDYGPHLEAISLVAAKIGCAGETLPSWVRRAERDQGVRPGPISEEHESIKALERENRERRQANEILRKASAYLRRRSLTVHSRMTAFIDDHCDVYGVEPICRVLPVAPVDIPRARAAPARSGPSSGTSATRWRPASPAYPPPGALETGTGRKFSRWPLFLLQPLKQALLLAAGGDQCREALYQGKNHSAKRATPSSIGVIGR